MIGILALQGGFDAHRQVLERLDQPTRLVRLPRDLEGLHGLILPGGESTTMLKLMATYDLFEPLDRLAQSGIPVLGTCAGAILMCDKVNSHDQKSFGWIPATIERNAYGSQRESFRTQQDCPLWQLEDVPALFIRAPKFDALGDGVAVLSRRDDEINGIVYKNFTAVTYHPELGEGTDFHQAWLDRFVVTAH